MTYRLTPDIVACCLLISNINGVRLEYSQYHNYLLSAQLVDHKRRSIKSKEFHIPVII